MNADRVKLAEIMQNRAHRMQSELFLLFFLATGFLGLGFFFFCFGVVFRDFSSFSF
ncbi:hypothetical protein BT69DRAFT_1284798 [Atractiella rhizophila]|nr:hypothetical protein BT69DRAFT_1284798 [Atractiella rhizophila]